MLNKKDNLLRESLHKSKNVYTFVLKFVKIFF